MNRAVEPMFATCAKFLPRRMQICGRCVHFCARSFDERTWFIHISLTFITYDLRIHDGSMRIPVESGNTYLWCENSCKKGKRIEHRQHNVQTCIAYWKSMNFMRLHTLTPISWCEFLHKYDDLNMYKCAHIYRARGFSQL